MSMGSNITSTNVVAHVDNQSSTVTMTSILNQAKKDKSGVTSMATSQRSHNGVIIDDFNSDEESKEMASIPADSSEGIIQSQAIPAGRLKNKLEMITEATDEDNIVSSKLQDDRATNMSQHMMTRSNNQSMDIHHVSREEKSKQYRQYMQTLTADGETELDEEERKGEHFRTEISNPVTQSSMQAKDSDYIDSNKPTIKASERLLKEQ